MINYVDQTILKEEVYKNYQFVTNFLLWKKINYTDNLNLQKHKVFEKPQRITKTLRTLPSLIECSSAEILMEKQLRAGLCLSAKYVEHSQPLPHGSNPVPGVRLFTGNFSVRNLWGSEPAEWGNTGDLPLLNQDILCSYTCSCKKLCNKSS